MLRSAIRVRERAQATDLRRCMDALRCYADTKADIVLAAKAASHAASVRALRIAWRYVRLAALCHRARRIARRHAVAFYSVASLRRALLQLARHARGCREHVAKHVTALTWSRRARLVHSIRCLKQPSPACVCIGHVERVQLRAACRRWGASGAKFAACAAAALQVAACAHRRAMRSALMPWVRSCRLRRHRSDAVQHRAIGCMHVALGLWRCRARGYALSAKAQRFYRRAIVCKWRRRSDSCQLAASLARSAALHAALGAQRRGMDRLLELHRLASCGCTLLAQAQRSSLRAGFRRFVSAHARRSELRSALAAQQLSGHARMARKRCWDSFGRWLWHLATMEKHRRVLSRASSRDHASMRRLGFGGWLLHLAAQEQHQRLLDAATARSRTHAMRSAWASFAALACARRGPFEHLSVSMAARLAFRRLADACAGKQAILSVEQKVGVLHRQALLNVAWHSWLRVATAATRQSWQTDRSVSLADKHGLTHAFGCWLRGRTERRAMKCLHAKLFAKAMTSRRWFAFGQWLWHLAALDKLDRTERRLSALTLQRRRLHGWRRWRRWHLADSHLLRHAALAHAQLYCLLIGLRAWRTVHVAQANELRAGEAVQLAVKRRRQAAVLQAMILAVWDDADCAADLPCVQLLTEAVPETDAVHSTMIATDEDAATPEKVAAMPEVVPSTTVHEALGQEAFATQLPIPNGVLPLVEVSALMEEVLLLPNQGPYTELTMVEMMSPARSSVTTDQAEDVAVLETSSPRSATALPPSHQPNMPLSVPQPTPLAAFHLQPQSVPTAAWDDAARSVPPAAGAAWRSRGSQVAFTWGGKSNILRRAAESRPQAPELTADSVEVSATEMEAPAEEVESAEEPATEEEVVAEVHESVEMPATEEAVAEELESVVISAMQAPAEELESVVISATQAPAEELESVGIPATQAPVEELESVAISATEAPAEELESVGISATQAPAEELESVGIPATQAPVEELESVAISATEAPAEELESVVISATQAPAEELESVAISATEAPAEELESVGISATEAPAEELESVAISATEAPAEELESVAIPATQAPVEELESVALSATEAPAEELESVGISATEAPVEELESVELPATEAPAEELESVVISATEAPAEELESVAIPATQAPVEELESVAISVTQAPAEELESVVISATEAPVEVHESVSMPTTEAAAEDVKVEEAWTIEEVDETVANAQETVEEWGEAVAFLHHMESTEDGQVPTGSQTTPVRSDRPMHEDLTEDAVLEPGVQAQPVDFSALPLTTTLAEWAALASPTSDAAPLPDVQILSRQPAQESGSHLLQGSGYPAQSHADPPAAALLATSAVGSGTSPAPVEPAFPTARITSESASASPVPSSRAMHTTFSSTVAEASAAADTAATSPENFTELVSAKLWNGSSECLLLASDGRIQLLEPRTSRPLHTWLFGDVGAVEHEANVVTVRLSGGWVWQRTLAFTLPSPDRAQLLHSLLAQRCEQRWAVAVSPLKRGRGSPLKSQVLWEDSDEEADDVTAWQPPVAPSSPAHASEMQMRGSPPVPPGASRLTAVDSQPMPEDTMANAEAMEAAMARATADCAALEQAASAVEHTVVKLSSPERGSASRAIAGPHAALGHATVERDAKEEDRGVDEALAASASPAEGQDTPTWGATATFDFASPLRITSLAHVPLVDNAAPAPLASPTSLPPSSPRPSGTASGSRSARSEQSGRSHQSEEDEPLWLRHASTLVRTPVPAPASARKLKAELYFEAQSIAQLRAVAFSCPSEPGEQSSQALAQQGNECQVQDECQVTGPDQQAAAAESKSPKHDDHSQEQLREVACADDVSALIPDGNASPGDDWLAATRALALTYAWAVWMDMAAWGHHVQMVARAIVQLRHRRTLVRTFRVWAQAARRISSTAEGHNLAHAHHEMASLHRAYHHFVAAADHAAALCELESCAHLGLRLLRTTRALRALQNATLVAVQGAHNELCADRMRLARAFDLFFSHGAALDRDRAKDNDYRAAALTHWRASSLARGFHELALSAEVSALVAAAALLACRHACLDGFRLWSAKLAHLMLHRAVAAQASVAIALRLQRRCIVEWRAFGSERKAASSSVVAAVSHAGRQAQQRAMARLRKARGASNRTLAAQASVVIALRLQRRCLVEWRAFGSERTAASSSALAAVSHAGRQAQQRAMARLREAWGTSSGALALVSRVELSRCRAAMAQLAELPQGRRELLEQRRVSLHFQLSWAWRRWCGASQAYTEHASAIAVLGQTAAALSAKLEQQHCLTEWRAFSGERQAAIIRGLASASHFVTAALRRSFAEWRTLSSEWAAVSSHARSATRHAAHQAQRRALTNLCRARSLNGCRNALLARIMRSQQQGVLERLAISARSSRTRAERHCASTAFYRRSAWCQWAEASRLCSHRTVLLAEHMRAAADLCATHSLRGSLAEWQFLCKEQRAAAACAAKARVYASQRVEQRAKAVMRAWRAFGSERTAASSSAVAAVSHAGRQAQQRAMARLREARGTSSGALALVSRVELSRCRAAMAQLAELPQGRRELLEQRRVSLHFQLSRAWRRLVRRESGLRPAFFCGNWACALRRRSPWPVDANLRVDSS